MQFLDTHPWNARAWRLAFIGSGVAMVIGGRMHPDADAKEPLRQELAIMTSDDSWVLSHSLIVLSTALLATGLWLADRSRSWPTSTRRALRLAAIAVSIYVVETVFHLASAVDTESLRDGDVAPVAFTHIALSIVLYPITGAAIAYLAAKQLFSARSPRWLVAVPGVAGGVLHALSVPLSVAFPDTELTAAFAGAAILIAIWSLGTGLVGLRETAPRIEPAVAGV
jgi:uncharacterized membrane protein YozB (DUF420 family)